jgi:hypothetical protein
MLDLRRSFCRAAFSVGPHPPVLYFHSGHRAFCLLKGVRRYLTPYLSAGFALFSSPEALLQSVLFQASFVPFGLVRLRALLGCLADLVDYAPVILSSCRRLRPCPPGLRQRRSERGYTTTTGRLIRAA